MDQYEKVKSPSKQAHFELQYELSSKKIDRKLKKIRFLTKVAFSVFSRLFLTYFAYIRETGKITEKSTLKCSYLSIWVF
jgi:hypothetical protein